MIMTGAAAMGAGVSILVSSFAPTHVNVLAGDTVTWSNDSVRRHTVTAENGSFGSSDVFPGAKYARMFDQPGAVAYYCTIHPFMRGEVDVFDLLLSAPREPGAPNRPYTLQGRSALDPGTPVSIEADSGSGYAPVGSTTVADDGTFGASVVPTSSATYRAVAGDASSPPVQLLVLDRSITATVSRRGPRDIVRVRVTPASPRATVVLQLHLRERFGWWPQRVHRLGPDSATTFRIHLHRRVRARVALTLSDGATQLAHTAVFRVGRPR